MSQRTGSIIQEPNYKRQQWRVCVFALLILIEAWDVSHVGYMCVYAPLQWDGSIKRNLEWPKDRLFWSWSNWVLFHIISASSTSMIWVIQMLHKNTALTQYTSIQIDKWPTKGFQQPLQLSVRRKFPFPVEKCSNAILCSLYITLCYIDCCIAWQLRPIKARIKNSKRRMPCRYKFDSGFGFWKKINFTYSKVRPNMISFT